MGPTLSWISRSTGPKTLTTDIDGKMRACCRAPTDVEFLPCVNHADGFGACFKRSVLCIDTLYARCSKRQRAPASHVAPPMERAGAALVVHISTLLHLLPLAIGRMIWLCASLIRRLIWNASARPQVFDFLHTS